MVRRHSGAGAGALLLAVVTTAVGVAVAPEDICSKPRRRPVDKMCSQTLTNLLEGRIGQWQGLPESCRVADVLALYGSKVAARTGKLSGKLLDYRDLKANDRFPAMGLWSDEQRIVRIDIDDPPEVPHLAEAIGRLGKPDLKRDPPDFYTYRKGRPVTELVYAALGLTLHVLMPRPPKHTSTVLARIRAYASCSAEHYDRQLGGRDPGKRLFRRF